MKTGYMPRYALFTCGFAKQFIRRTGNRHTSGLENISPACELERGKHVLFHENDGDALLVYLPNETAQLLHQPGSKTQGKLIDQ